MGRSKGKAGVQLKCIPAKRDIAEMYPGKVMHNLVYKPLIQMLLALNPLVLNFNPQCNVTVMYRFYILLCA